MLLLPRAHALGVKQLVLFILVLLVCKTFFFNLANYALHSKFSLVMARII